MEQTTGNGRVIIHLDLDCFYAQVEQRRLQIPATEPVAVQQWGSLLAVNYVARAAGVKRGDHSSVAIQKCPSIHLPHVDTLGENRRPGEVFDRKHQKAILRRYRIASRAIFEILAAMAPVYEKAGIDEAYLDVSAQAAERLARADCLSSDFCAEEANSDTKVLGISVIKGYEPPEKDDEGATTAFPVTESERLLCIGATIAREIRAAIFQKLGYTCSTGVACNKLLAKLGSPLNKPDGQAIVPPRFVLWFMARYPMRSVQRLGGKLGQQLEEIYKAHMASQPGGGGETEVTAQALRQHCSIDVLARHLGRDTAVFVHQFCDGDDQDEPINTKKVLIKAFSSTKQFDDRSKLICLPQLVYWIRVLSEEIVLRCEDERIDNERVPTAATIHFTRGAEKPKTRKIASFSPDWSLEELYEATYDVLRRDMDNMFPCTHLVLHVKDFVPAGSHSAVPKISSFFSKQEQEDESAESAVFSEERFQLPLPRVSKPDKASFFHCHTGTTRSSSPTRQEQPQPIPNEPDEEESMAAPPTLSSLVTLLTESFHCERCQKQIVEPKQEHEDYHFAQELRREQHAEAAAAAKSTTTNTTTGARSSTRRKANNTTSKGSKKPKLGTLDAFLRR